MDTNTLGNAYFKKNMRLLLVGVYRGLDEEKLDLNRFLLGQVFKFTYVL